MYYSLFRSILSLQMMKAMTKKVPQKVMGTLKRWKIQNLSLTILQIERVTMNMRKMEMVYRIKQNQWMKMKRM